MTPAFSKWQSWQQYSGFRLGIDQRFYNAHTNATLFGAVGFVVNRANFLNAGNYMLMDSTIRYDTVHLHKTNLIFNITYGIQTPLSWRFVFDFSTGIGIKYRQMKQDQPGMLIERETDWISSAYYLRAGHMWGVTFPLIIRLGYRF